MNNSRILKIKNAKFSGHYFYMNLNIWADFQFCISVPLRFDEYFTSLCRKAGKKLSVLARISNFMCTNKKRVLIKAFIESQFGCCPLIWMFHNRRVNSKTNHLHEQSYEVPLKTILIVSKIYLKGIRCLLFIRGTPNQL